MRFVSQKLFPLVSTYKTTTAADKMIKIWSAYNGQIVRTLEGHTAGLSDIAWSTDSVFLASASDDTTIRIWNIDLVYVPYYAECSVAECTKGTSIKILKGHSAYVFCLNYNPASNLLVSGGYDETVRIWDVSRGLFSGILRN